MTLRPSTLPRESRRLLLEKLVDLQRLNFQLSDRYGLQPRREVMDHLSQAITTLRDENASPEQLDSTLAAFEAAAEQFGTLPE